MESEFTDEELEEDFYLFVAVGRQQWQLWITMLCAKDIDFVADINDFGEYCIFVREVDRDIVLAEIECMADESRHWPPKETIESDDLRFSPMAFIVAIILWYAFFFTSSHSHYIELGSAKNYLILDGEYYRCLTALFLHADLGHIASNAIAIYLFMSFMIKRLGAGVASLMVLIGGTLGNLANAGFYHDQWHNSIGASTAVFAALGSIGVIRAWERFVQHKSFNWRLQPIIAVVCIFSMIGVSTTWTNEMRPSWEGNIDYMAHFFGFLWGAVLALLYPILSKYKQHISLQTLACTLVLIIVLGAWLLAIN